MTLWKRTGHPGTVDTWISGTSLLIVLLGFVSGVLSGLFGIGGAVLTTPGIRLLGASPILAVGSTVPAILPGAISGSIRYHKAGLIDWRMGLICGSAGSAFAVAGAWLADGIDGHVLMLATALLGAWSGISVFRSGKAAAAEPVATRSDGRHPRSASGIEIARTVHEPTTNRRLGLAAGGPAAALGIPSVDPVGLDTVPAGAPVGPVGTPVSASVLALVGAGSGLVAGLLGVGGGVVMMPVFTNVLKVPMKKAVASSLVAVAIFSLPALITHAVLGHIDWRFALLLIAGVVPGARVGAKLAIGASEVLVRKAFGIFLVVLAAGYAIGEIIDLRS